MPSTRYQTLVKSDTVLCSDGCPVIIEANAIVNDTRTNQVLAQLKLKNISDRVIIACKVAVAAFEVNGSVLNGVDAFSYLDLAAKQGDVFGIKTPVYLPNNITRIIKPSVIEIVFDNHEIWTSQGKEWKPIPQQDKIQFADPELQRQFKMEAGGSSLYRPVLFGDFFRCSCGTVNIQGNKCYKCQNTFEKVQTVLEDEEGLKERKEERLNNNRYQDAVYKGNKQNDKASLLSARNLFEKLGSYKDSEERARKCQERITQIEEKEEQERIRQEEERTRKAKEQEEAEKKEQERIAKEKKKKKKRRILFVSIAVPFCLILGVFYFIFWPNIKFKTFQSALRSANVGDTVTLGNYNSKNIEWIVLEKDGNRTLLISKNAVDRKPFNVEYKSTSWGSCTLRYWLNDEFFYDAFSPLEQSVIIKSSRTDYNPKYEETAEERLFLLSCSEAEHYFSNYAYRTCNYNDESCWWWLRARSKSPVKYGAPRVKEDGHIDLDGTSVAITDGAVRPAMWVDSK